MDTLQLIDRMRRFAGRLAGDERGNIAVTFAVALVPIISFIGAAVDYTRANNARSSMQAALDSTALWVSKDDSAGNLTAAQVTAKAQAYFNALYKGKGASNITVTATYSTNAALGQNIVLTGSGSIATQFPNMTFNTTSTAAWGTTKLRVALALDNTGSMQFDGKMGALQTAAKNLIDQLSGSAQNAGDVYISVVPFANVVNLGTSFKNSGYIDWSSWSTRGSVEEGSFCGSFNFGSSMKCGSSNNNTNNWNGCVMDRGTAAGPATSSTSGPDVVVTAPTTSAYYFPADQSSYCPEQIVPLSYSWQTLKNTVNAMTPAGSTNQPIGLVWAWQTLQQSTPFNAPAEDPNYTYKKAIILLSDGLNTKDRWYGDGANYSSEVDDRQKLLCDNVKAAGITLYTIQVNTGGDPTSTVLSYCASGSANFYMLTSANQVISTFNSIGTSLAKLRIAR